MLLSTRIDCTCKGALFSKYFACKTWQGRRKNYVLPPALKPRKKPYKQELQLCEEKRLYLLDIQSPLTLLVAAALDVQ